MDAGRGGGDQREQIGGGPRVVLEVRLHDSDQRWPTDGEEAFGAGPAIARALLFEGGGDDSWREGLRRDSWVDLLLPELDVDSARTHRVRLTFFTGRDPVVLISAADDLPEPTLRFAAVAAVAPFLEEKDLEGKGFLDLAARVRYAGIWVLAERLRLIEGSVRAALRDERFSAAELGDLTDYPERLAKVEAAADELAGKWPTWKSAEPDSGALGGFRASDLAPDGFGKSTEELIRQAREASGRLSALISSQQIVLTQRRAEETARFQRVVTIVGAAVLVPGLVAAVFGANVGFHGRDSTSAFWAMLALMAAGGLLSYGLIRSLEDGLPARLATTLPLRRLAQAPTTVWICASLLGGLALFALGVAILLG
jgi:hypothetical protein